MRHHENRHSHCDNVDLVSHILRTKISSWIVPEVSRICCDRSADVISTSQLATYTLFLADVVHIFSFLAKRHWCEGFASHHFSNESILNITTMTMKIAVVLYQRTQPRRVLATLYGMPTSFTTSSHCNSQTRSYHSSNPVSISFNDKSNTHVATTTTSFQQLQAMFKSTLAPSATSTKDEENNKTKQKRW